MPKPARSDQSDAIDRLSRFVERHPGLLVLTGAGVSTASGIPDYRDHDGRWKHRQPVRYQEFLHSESVRQRYWARSLIGWPRFARARPNEAHRALARLEVLGYVQHLVTQNVDGLHQRAGHRRVLDLHGRLDRVECLGCGHAFARETFQQTLQALNPQFGRRTAALTPDGDADPGEIDVSVFRVPGCRECGGVLKPAVVFFGECVARRTVERVHTYLDEADAVVAIGSSLMVYSAYRFCRAAVDQGKPVAAVNLGRTRADAELTLKVIAPCAEALGQLVERLAPGTDPDALRH